MHFANLDARVPSQGASPGVKHQRTLPLEALRTPGLKDNSTKTFGANALLCGAGISILLSPAALPYEEPAIDEDDLEHVEHHLEEARTQATARDLQHHRTTGQHRLSRRCMRDGGGPNWQPTPN